MDPGALRAGEVWLSGADFEPGLTAHATQSAAFG